MAKLSPYLNFNGNAEEAFNFYKSVFGKEFTMISRFKDTPADTPVEESEGEKILHVSLQISEETFLMGSDIPSHYPKATMGTNFFISIHADSKEEADRIFNALSAGGTVLMPMDNTFWGSYFGMCTDKFGVQWMMSFDTQQK